MAQTVFGQTDALAQAIVAWINTNAAIFCVAPSAERRFNPLYELPAIPTFEDAPSVDVVPGGIAVHRESLATFTSQYAVNLFIQQQLAGCPDEDELVGLLIQLQSELLESLRTAPLELPNAVHKVKFNQLGFLDSKPGDGGLYSLPRLREARVFESDTILIFKAAV